jgi:hypothetical protein
MSFNFPNIDSESVRLATMLAAIFLTQSAMSASTPVTIDALNSAPMLTTGLDRGTAIQTAAPPSGNDGGSTKAASVVNQGRRDDSLSLNPHDVKGDAQSSPSNHLGRDESHNTYQGRHFELEGTGAPFSPVPLPAALWLFGTGVVGLAGAVSYRRKSKNLQRKNHLAPDSDISHRAES